MALDLREAAQSITAESVLPGLRYRLQLPAWTSDTHGLWSNARIAASYITSLAGGAPQVSFPPHLDPVDGEVRETVVICWNEGPETGPRILQIGHYDVVPNPEGPFGLSTFHSMQHDRRYLVGRGTIDNAGNDLIIGGSLGMLRKLTGTVGNVTVVLSPDEELASPTGRHAVLEQASSAQLILGYEGAGPDGEWVDERLGIANVVVTFSGSATHSNNPAPNAAAAAARFATAIDDAIARRPIDHNERGLPSYLYKLGGLQTNTFVANSSPDTAKVAFTVRSRDAAPGEIEGLVNRVANAVVAYESGHYGKDSPPVTFDFSVRSFPAWQASPHNRASGVTGWAHRMLGSHRARPVSRFGGSDTALAATVSPTGYAVDGLGARSHPDARFGPHTVREAMSLDNLGQQMAVSALLIASGQGRRQLGGVRIGAGMNLSDVPAVAR